MDGTWQEGVALAAAVAEDDDDDHGSGEEPGRDWWAAPVGWGVR